MKRLNALLLALALIALCLAPLAVSAETTTPEETTPPEETTTPEEDEDDGILDAIGNLAGDIASSIGDTILAPITNAISAIGDKLNGLGETVSGLANSIAERVKEKIVTPIVDGIKGIFVPSEDYLTDKVNALRDRFAFADSIIGTCTEIADIFKTFTGTPPKIEIDFGNAESKFGYDYGGQAYALDMTWYARYKGTVDTIVGAFIVGGFIWRLRHNLPNIIAGVGNGFSTVNGTIVRFDAKGGDKK